MITMTETKPLEDAPFEIYLKILRENGHQEDADISEALYVELLTTVKSSDGRPFTREQVMKAPFKNLVKAAKIILDEMEKEEDKEKLQKDLSSIREKMILAAGSLGSFDDILENAFKNFLNKNSKRK